MERIILTMPGIQGWLYSVFRYGIPGKRNANQKLRTCCRRLKDADIECRRRYCDFNALRPEMDRVKIWFHRLRDGGLETVHDPADEVK
ncbi:hypothetical protein ANCDUO_04585 [Ancylostoma duodenale]|uniref:Uncharacterized protein n=1 Tax=Ancylostoma duodenale TaxID=51022 RepID=A0A0C2H6M5_9BILA|nr:hypothetical protein ANCDUO_04585 [Ancylostoma duodenale]